MNKVKNALELALGVFREPYCDAPLDDVIKACEEALEIFKQEQGEPVAWLRDPKHYPEDTLIPHVSWEKERLNTIPLYTTPQQRTWVGLTPEEMRECNYDGDIMIDRETAKLNVQAKLKEKNT
jgi:hypothetical protein